MSNVSRVKVYPIGPNIEAFLKSPEVLSCLETHANSVKAKAKNMGPRKSSDYAVDVRAGKTRGRAEVVNTNWGGFYDAVRDNSLQKALFGGK